MYAQKLTAAIASGHLTARDAEFAASLLTSVEKYGKLTARQEYWADVITSRAKAPVAAAPMTTAQVPAAAEIRAHFDKARSVLKWPKVRLTRGDTRVVLSVAGDRSKYAGQIMLTDGGPFGANVYYGRIDLDGWIHPTNRLCDDAQRLVEELMVNFAATAARIGKESGHCVFCERPLSDPRSLEVGYGKICAGHYALPW